MIQGFSSLPKYNAGTTLMNQAAVQSLVSHSGQLDAPRSHTSKTWNSLSPLLPLQQLIFQDVLYSKDTFNLCIPPRFETRNASWFFGVLDRFWFLCLFPAERILRRCTSVALKKATVKGCLFCGPCLPMRPASLGLRLCPREEGGEERTY